MIRERPREQEWISWLVVLLSIAVIWATIPFARDVSDFVGKRWGRDLFRDGVMILVVAGVGAALLAVARIPNFARRNILWLLLVGALLSYFTVGVRASPEETIHFAEYFVLGFFLFRALSHRTRDVGIYAIALLLGATVGLVDEAIQWFTPERVFDLRDVGFNALGTAVAQVAISQGFSPPFIRRNPQPETLRRVCLYAALFVTLLWLCLANTPAVMQRLVCRLPQFWYLLYKSSAMSEYGYKHHLPGVGTFFSRFTLTELQQRDAQRAEEVAAILNAYHDPRKYGKFLRTYTPLTDPFVHEARVHLYRRDHYLAVTPKYRGNPTMRRYHYTVAWREHQFMKICFSNSLARSYYRWRPEVEHAIREESDPALEYVSDVSANLITAFSQRTVHWIFSGLLLLLAGGWAFSWGLERRGWRESP